SAEAVRKRLLRDPWIEDARVAWGLGTISIELTERQPVALLRYTDRFYLLLDESGTILEQTELDAYKGLPVITGRDFMQPLRGFRSDNEGLLDAVSLSARMAPALRSQISEIHADPDRTLTLYMVPGATVRWGLLPDGENRAELVADKVNWFGGIWQELNKRSGTCHIDLRVDGKEAVSGCQ
ncbi:MAG TPA: cell division protein FtsQ/DivIB, partial [Symbiobacteriaceae bacterium]|nr:cell division protein FtsQ/DivIB [Symbiobacteriaceae bacterium]